MSFVEDLDYVSLISHSKDLEPPAGAVQLRLAVLADFTTRQLIDVMRVLAVRRGVDLRVYEADYDSVDVEILNPASGLYQFKPDFVALLGATEKLKARYHAAAESASFADDTVRRFAGLWDALRAHSSATIIQSTYVRPSERAFGNFELLANHSLGASVLAVNAGLMREATARHGTLLCDLDHLAGEIGRRIFADERLWALAKLPCRMQYLPCLAQELLGVVLTASGRMVKCVVLDLDNTMWGGVIGDDGLSGILLGGYDEGQAFVTLQHFLRALRRRGIILAVVSKNEEAAARMPFREHPDMVLREEDIAVFIANWENKADNIRIVQKVLNIGFDSMVFLDDNPFERNLVREYLPEVIVPELPEDPAAYLPYLAKLNLFETASFSEADRARADLYREEASRAMAAQVFANVDDYLASLDMRARVERFTPVNLPRITQLIQRSNQFNLATRRHGEAACAAFMADTAGYMPFTVTLSDRFGDYGLISLAVLYLYEDALEINELVMSCRVLRRGVEQLVMNTIFAVARDYGKARVIGCYRPTAKNAMVRDFYTGFGFTPMGEDHAEGSLWQRDVATWQATPVFITVDTDPSFAPNYSSAH